MPLSPSRTRLQHFNRTTSCHCVVAKNSMCSPQHGPAPGGARALFGVAALAILLLRRTEAQKIAAENATRALPLAFLQRCWKWIGSRLPSTANREPLEKCAPSRFQASLASPVSPAPPSSETFAGFSDLRPSSVGFEPRLRPKQAKATARHSSSLSQQRKASKPLPRIL